MKKCNTIAVINHKGGVGKTTTVSNLSYTFANLGYKVLAIDFDSQASLTNCLNIGLKSNETYYGIYELMVKELREIEENENQWLSKATFEEVLDAAIARPTYLAREIVGAGKERKVIDVQKEFGFDLLPSHIIFADYELELNQSISNKNGFRLYNIIQKIKQLKDYDYIIIDCPPSLGTLSMNAIAAATEGILIPTNLDLMSTRGVENLIEKVADVQNLLLKNAGITHMGIIGVELNLYNESRSIDKSIEQNLNKFYPVVTFKARIPESTYVKKAVYAGILYAQNHKKANEAYIKLAKEIIKRLAEMEKEGQKILHLSPGEMRKIGSALDEIEESVKQAKEINIDEKEGNL